VLLLRGRPRNIDGEAVIASGGMDRQLHLLKSGLRALLGWDVLGGGLRAARDERGRRDCG
jgi:hypothetical protein